MLSPIMTYDSKSVVSRQQRWVPAVVAAYLVLVLQPPHILAGHSSITCQSTDVCSPHLVLIVSILQQPSQPVHGSLKYFTYYSLSSHKRPCTEHVDEPWMRKRPAIMKCPTPAVNPHNKSQIWMRNTQTVLIITPRHCPFTSSLRPSSIR